MKTNYLLIAILLFAAVILAACGTRAAASPTVPEAFVPTGTQPGQLTGLEGCEYQPEGRKMKYLAECGTLTVPENWDVPGSRLIALPVVRIPATGSDPAEPVFWLEGGPGNTNFTYSPPDWLLKDHALVIVGYRGADGSVLLSCPEVSAPLKAHLGKDLWSEPARAQYVDGARQCAARHQAAGVDFSGYTIPAVVADMEAARNALGYERIDLLSVSYGTRVAQIYAYLNPSRLHRVVMVSVNTPGHFLYDPAATDEQIRYYSELCARDVNCSSRTTDLAQTMYDVNHNMPTHWLFFNIDPDTVRLASYYRFFSNPNMALIFDGYLAAGEGDPSGLAMANLAVQLMLPLDKLVFGEAFSVSGTADLDRYRGLESISLGNSIMGAPYSELLWPLAAVWPVELIPEDLRGFQESDVEMLLVNGSVDFSTPPTALDEARPYFHKAQMVLLPEFGHVADVMGLQPEAFERLITSYYNTGVADDSLYVYQPLPFKPGLSSTVIARLLVAAIVLLPALLVLLIVLVVRRIRGRRASK